MHAAPEVLFRAWTAGFDRRFAAPGSVRSAAAVDTPFCFGVRHGDERHPHDGRCPRPEPGRLVEPTRPTGEGGTKGAETVVTLELAPSGSGTRLRLTHAGFPDEASRAGHERAWPAVLARLDERMAAPDPSSATRRIAGAPVVAGILAPSAQRVAIDRMPTDARLSSVESALAISKVVTTNGRSDGTGRQGEGRRRPPTRPIGVALPGAVAATAAARTPESALENAPSGDGSSWRTSTPRRRRPSRCRETRSTAEKRVYESACRRRRSRGLDRRAQSPRRAGEIVLHPNGRCHSIQDGYVRSRTG